jgi:hypothetical protein
MPNQLQKYQQQANLRIYFENAAGRVLEHPKGFAVFRYHPGPRKLTDLQALLTHTGLLLNRNKWNKLLGDQRLMSPLTAEEGEWIVEYWLDTSRHSQEGIYGAVILANDVFARLAMSQVVNEMKAAALTYRMFDNEAQAEAWLLQLPG